MGEQNEGTLYVKNTNKNIKPTGCCSGCDNLFNNLRKLFDSKDKHRIFKRFQEKNCQYLVTKSDHNLIYFHFKQRQSDQKVEEELRQAGTELCQAQFSLS